MPALSLLRIFDALNRKLICIMEKILCLIVFMLSCFTIHAQSQNQQEEIKALVQRVDSLEHELSYLKLSYDLNALNTDISMFINELNIKSIDIQMNIVNREFYHAYSDLFQKYYEAVEGKKQSMSGYIEVTKRYYFMNIMTNPYSKIELDALNAKYDVIVEAYESLENSMDMLKLIIDKYNAHLQAFLKP